MARSRVTVCSRVTPKQVGGLTLWARSICNVRGNYKSFFVGTNIQQASAVRVHQPYDLFVRNVGNVRRAVDPRDYPPIFGFNLRGYLWPQNEQTIGQESPRYLYRAGREHLQRLSPRFWHRRPRIRSNGSRKCHGLALSFLLDLI